MPAIGSLVGYAQDDLTPNLAAQTANGNTGALGGWGEVSQMLVQLNVTAASGTSPSLTVHLEHSLDGINWYTIAGSTFAPATGTGIVGTAPLNPTGPFFDKIRVVWVISGTSPSFTFDVQATSYSKLS